MASKCTDAQSFKDTVEVEAEGLLAAKDLSKAKKARDSLKAKDALEDGNWLKTKDTEETIKDSIRDILVYIGEDLTRDGLQDTPERIVKMWSKIFSGYKENARELLIKTFEVATEAAEMILLKNIQFYSMCEHHMLPFFGRVSVGYVPVKKVVGVSKLARVVEVFARRLQIQERMTTEIADAIQEALKPLGVAVLVEARHLCMTSRGVEKQGSVMVTSAMYGLYRYNEAARNEFLSLCKLSTQEFV